MIKILNVEIEDLENAGCNNGNYPHYKITYDNNGKTATIEGITCRCHKGCSNTDCIEGITVGDTYENEEELLDLIKGD